MALRGLAKPLQSNILVNDSVALKPSFLLEVQTVRPRNRVHCQYESDCHHTTEVTLDYLQIGEVP
jgi:hypothetical protein